MTINDGLIFAYPLGFQVLFIKRLLFTFTVIIILKQPSFRIGKCLQEVWSYSTITILMALLYQLVAR